MADIPNTRQVVVGNARTWENLAKDTGHSVETLKALNPNIKDNKVGGQNLVLPTFKLTQGTVVTPNNAPATQPPQPTLVQQPTIQAPTFDQNAYYNDNAARMTEAANRQRDLNLTAFRQARDKSVGEIGTLKNDANVAFQQNRDQTDFQSRVAANRLREMMAAQGLGNSGENVTGQVGINTANQNNLNALNLAERRTIDDYDKEIRDLLDPSKEYNITEQSSVDLLDRLTDLQMRAADRKYDNDWRTADFNRAGEWRLDDESDEDRAFNADQQWRNVDNGWKTREWNRQTTLDKQEQARYADELAYARKMDAIQLARSAAKSSGGGRRSSGGSSKSSGSGGYIDIHKTLAAGNKYFDSLPGDKYNSYGQKTSNGVGTATKAALKNEYNQALQRYSGKDGYAKFQAEKDAIRKAQPDTADYLINALENAFAYRK